MTEFNEIENKYDLGVEFYTKRIEDINEKLKATLPEDHLASINLLEELRITEVRLKFTNIRKIATMHKHDE